MSINKQYSEQELDQIVTDIKAASGYKNHVYLDGRQVPKDWNEGAFISENLYEDFLRAVQTKRLCKATQKPYTSNSTFEEYLSDCKENLAFRKLELASERDEMIIDQRTYNNAKMVADLALEAIQHYLEQTERQRLIGV